MNIRPRHLAAGLVLAGAFTAPGCMSVANAATACGGNQTIHPAPIDCTNTVTIQGVTGGAHLTVNTSGAIHVDAQVSNKTVALYLQVKAHDGISTSSSFMGATAVFANGLASVNTQMPGCLSQIDIKIVPGTPTLDHVSDIYRVAAPLVSIDCSAPTTVVTTTVPQSSTTVPATSVPSSTVPPQTSVPQPTTSAPTASSVTSKVSGGTLPPTGSSSAWAVLIGLGMVIVGLLAITAMVLRRPS